MKVEEYLDCRVRLRGMERDERRKRIDAGEEHLGFLAETAEVRARDWRVASAPHDLLRRAVEITGPTDRKMMINALNSGADVFMADLEDSSAPTWANVLSGQVNLYDAVRRTISWDDPDTGKAYRLNDRTATLIVRPRGLHLVERHLLLDGSPVPGALVDAAISPKVPGPHPAKDQASQRTAIAVRWGRRGRSEAGHQQLLSSHLNVGLRQPGSVHHGFHSLSPFAPPPFWRNRLFSSGDMFLTFR